MVLKTRIIFERKMKHRKSSKKLAIDHLMFFLQIMTDLMRIDWFIL